MSHGWLSRRLSMRQNPVIFPALEAGKIGFGQANELLGAPAVARRTLLDRVLRRLPRRTQFVCGSGTPSERYVKANKPPLPRWPKLMASKSKRGSSGSLLLSWSRS
jgi:hypothetical protein